MTTPHVYIAGPMRGYPYFNFDAFYAAEVEVGKHFGWDDIKAHPAQYGVSGPGVRGTGNDKVVMFNPARYDHETIGPKVNDSPTGDLKDIEGVFDLRHALGRDLEWIAKNATHIYLLDGWEKSSGARAEKALADALGLEVLYQTEPNPLPSDLAQLASTTHTVPVYTNQDVGWGKVTAEYLTYTPEELADMAASVEWETTAPGEVRVTSETGGQKGSKLARFDLIPVGPLTTLAELYGKGAEKYADRNWERGYDWSLSYAALQRHLTAFWGGQDNDPEHGLPHLASVAWHAFAMMEWANTHPEFDNRPKG